MGRRRLLMKFSGNVNDENMRAAILAHISSTDFDVMHDYLRDRLQWCTESIAGHMHLS